MASLALNLADLRIGMPGLTAARGEALAEAAAVCLDSIPHASGVACEITGSLPSSALITWPTVDIQQRMTHADSQEATENGAAALAVLAIKNLTGMSVRERAAKGTGVDYWLGLDNDLLDEELPFQNLTRLEVSGILSGDEAAVLRRTNQKLLQTAPTDDVCPAYVAIVEFSQPLIHLEAK